MDVEYKHVKMITVPFLDIGDGIEEGQLIYDLAKVNDPVFYAEYSVSRKNLTKDYGKTVVCIEPFFVTLDEEVKKGDLAIVYKKKKKDALRTELVIILGRVLSNNSKGIKLKLVHPKTFSGINDKNEITEYKNSFEITEDDPSCVFKVNLTPSLIDKESFSRIVNQILANDNDCEYDTKKEGLIEIVCNPYNYKKIKDL